LSDFLIENKIKTAIVTSTKTDEAVDCLKSAGIYSRFGTVVGFGDTPTGKPTPLPYIKAMNRLGVTCAESLAFEDSPNGIRSAVSAGIRTVFIKDLAEPPRDVLETVYARLENLQQGIKFIQKFVCKGEKYAAR
jgi:beta-phosphoglucomutase-like phosphatase (HAD superfamily)